MWKRLLLLLPLLFLLSPIAKADKPSDTQLSGQLTTTCSNTNTSCLGTAGSQVEISSPNYSTATVTVHGTYGGFTINFEFSDDGGTNYYPVSCGLSSSSSQSGTSDSPSDNSSVAYGCTITGTIKFRVRASARTSGTMNVMITLSSSSAGGGGVGGGGGGGGGSTPGHFSVLAYGAKGDDVTDDTAAFQSAINACANSAGAGGFVVVPPAPISDNGYYFYRLDSALTFPPLGVSAPFPEKNCTLYMEGSINSFAAMHITAGWLLEGAYVWNNYYSSYTTSGQQIVDSLNTSTFAYGSHDPFITIGSESDSGVNTGELSLKNLFITTFDATAVMIGPAPSTGGNIGVNIDHSVILNGACISQPCGTAKSALKIRDTQKTHIFNHSVIGNTDISTGYAVDYGWSWASGSLILYDFDMEDSTMVEGGMIVNNDVTGGGPIKNITLRHVSGFFNTKPLLTVDTTNTTQIRGLDLYEDTTNALGLGALIDNLPILTWSGGTGTVDNVVLVYSHAVDAAKAIVVPNGKQITNLVVEGLADSYAVSPAYNVFATRTGQENLLANEVNAGPGNNATPALNVVMTPPQSLAVNCAITGGTLAAGTYHYVLTHINGVTAPADPVTGVTSAYESWVTPDVSGTVASGTTGSCVLTWTNSTGYTGTNVYGRTAYVNNSQNKQEVVSTRGLGVTTYTDTGGMLLSPTPPTWDKQSGNAPVVHFSGSGNNWILSGPTQLASYTVSTLPSAATSGAGAMAIVTDATTFTVGASCTGGGSDYMIAVSNGAAWSCH